MAARMVSINWDKVDRGLANLFNQRQIAEWLGVDARTLREACLREKGIPWSEYAESQRGNTLCFIANRVITEALNGDNALLLHLAKVHLGWNEKQQLEIEQRLQAEVTAVPVIDNIPTPEQIAMAMAMAKAKLELESESEKKCLP